MAGVKGRSGSGGARPGAGRPAKPKEPEKTPEVCDERDPLEFLLKVMQGTVDPTPSQLRAAVAAAQYVHLKKGDGGKKDEVADKAKRAGAGKFGAAAPPLKLVGSK